MIARIVGSFRRSAGPRALSGAIKGRLATGTGSLRGCARSAERIARRRSGGVLGLVSGREGGLGVPAVGLRAGTRARFFRRAAGLSVPSEGFGVWLTSGLFFLHRSHVRRFVLVEVALNGRSRSVRLRAAPPGCGARGGWM
ncbi:hypothetical protein Mapa_013401 [Marchantia paleacea]|nr:hypothetical protein Mapa_013401 [Marchantia paleacea]